MKKQIKVIGIITICISILTIAACTKKESASTKFAGDYNGGTLCGTNELLSIYTDLNDPNKIYLNFQYDSIIPTATVNGNSINNISGTFYSGTAKQLTVSGNGTLNSKTVTINLYRAFNSTKDTCVYVGTKL